MNIGHHSLLIYSHSTMGKTCLVGQLVRALLPRFGPGAKARLYTAETYDSIQDEIKEGLVDVWKFNTRDHPFETTHFAMDGFWCENPDDPKSKIVAPTAETPEKFPIRIYEGLATTASYLAGNYVSGAVADRLGKGESIGPADSKDGPVHLVDGDSTVAGLSRSNYGFVQNEMDSNVCRSQKLPGIVIWTAQEEEAEEKKDKIKTGRVIVGPKVFGAALTQFISKHFGNVWRIVGLDQDYQTADGPRRVVNRRCYIKSHIDPLQTDANEIKLPAIARNSGGLTRQASLPDYYMLTDPAGMPRVGIGQKIVEELGL